MSKMVLRLRRKAGDGLTRWCRQAERWPPLGLPIESATIGTSEQPSSAPADKRRGRHCPPPSTSRPRLRASGRGRRAGRPRGAEGSGRAAKRPAGGSAAQVAADRRRRRRAEAKDGHAKGPGVVVLYAGLDPEVGTHRRRRWVHVAEMETIHEGAQDRRPGCLNERSCVASLHEDECTISLRLECEAQLVERDRHRVGVRHTRREAQSGDRCQVVQRRVCELGEEAVRGRAPSHELRALFHLYEGRGKHRVRRHRLHRADSVPKPRRCVQVACVRPRAKKKSGTQVKNKDGSRRSHNDGDELFLQMAH